MKDVNKVEYNKLYAFNVSGGVTHGVVAIIKDNIVTVWNNQAKLVDIDLRACTRIVQLTN